MFQWLHPSISPARPTVQAVGKSVVRSTDRFPLRGETVEAFPQAIECRVTSDIGVLKKGRVMANGYSWKAMLYDHDCQATLLPGQPVFAIGRQGLVLIVVPYHCLI